MIALPSSSFVDVQEFQLRRREKFPSESFTIFFLFISKNKSHAHKPHLYSRDVVVSVARRSAAMPSRFMNDFLVIYRKKRYNKIMMEINKSLNPEILNGTVKCSQSKFKLIRLQPRHQTSTMAYKMKV